MQYPIIDLISSAYINNGWTGLDIPETITFEPKQLGSGEPSPDNIRPIEGTFIPSYGTVYGGTLDVTTGVLTVDKTMDMYNWGDGISAIVLGSYERRYFNTSYPCVDALQVQTPDISNIAPMNVSWDGDFLHFYANGPANRLFFFLPTGSSANTLIQSCYHLATPITYQCTNEDISYLLAKYSSSILKLPLPHYFPHPVIDALHRAAAGTQTADDTEILRHYLTPLGIGGI